MRYAVIALVFGSVLSLSSFAAPAGAPPTRTVPALPEPVKPVRFNRAWVDTFSTYIYSFGDIIPFSYEDSTELEIKDELGATVWSGILNADTFLLVPALTGGYFIQGNKRYAILTGDATSAGCTGFFAVDQYGLPLSTKLLTYMPLKFSTPGWQTDETFIVFGYQNSTDVVVRNLETKELLWQGSLDKAEHYSFYPGKIPVMVTATKPVSALSYADQDWYIPASEGNFVGTLFYTWVGRVGSSGGWQNDLNIFPWQDSTTVTVTNTESGATIWTGQLNEGKVHTVLASHVYVTIQSDKPISAVITPFFSYRSDYYHMQRCIDSTGMGIGRKFYVCACAATKLLDDFILVYSFEDSTAVEITDTRTGTVDWRGVLNKGQFQKHTSKNTFYRVTATKPVCVYETGTNNLQAAGSDFAPLWFILRPAVKVEPDQSDSTLRAVPVRYQLIVTNAGNSNEVIDLRVNHSRPNWSMTLYDSTGTAPLTDHNNNQLPDVGSLERHGGEANFFIEITPADSAPPGEIDTCQIIARSSVDTSVTDTATIFTTVIVRAKLIVEPNQSDSIYSGDSLSYLLEVTNQGTNPDLVDIQLQGTRADWSANLWDSAGTNSLPDQNNNSLPDLGLISANGGSLFLSTRIKAPLNALAGTVDTTQVIGLSNLIPGIADTALLLTTIRTRAEIQVEPDTVDSVWAGKPVRYRLAVTNNGNGPDCINIVPALGHPSWLISLFDSTGVTRLRDHNADGTVDVDTVPAYGGKTQIWVELKPPITERHGIWDTTVIVGHSTLDQSVSDEANLVTKVLNILPNIQVDPDTAATTGPETPVTYIMRVLNLGNETDTVDLVVAGPWQAEVLDTLDHPLPDRNGNGIPDLGPIRSKATIRFHLKITPPSGLGFIVGTVDSTIVGSHRVGGRSFLDTLVTDSARTLTTVVPELNVHNYPNPFPQGPTTFIFSLPDDGKVTLQIFNRAGELIKTVLKDSPYSMGVHTYPWDGKNQSEKLVAPGVYIYALTFTGNGVYTGLYKRAKSITKKAAVIP